MTLLAAHPQSASHIKRNSFFVPLGILVATGPAEAQFLGVCILQDFARLVKLGEHGTSKSREKRRMRCTAYLVVANRSHMLIYILPKSVRINHCRLHDVTAWIRAYLAYVQVLMVTHGALSTHPLCVAAVVLHLCQSDMLGS